MTAGVVEALGQRIRMLIGRGRVRTGSDSAGVQMLQVQLASVETGDNRPRMAEFGFSSMPPADTDAVVVFLTGDRSAGVVVATNHQASRPRGLKPGETIVYSQDGKCVYFSDAGIVVDAKGQSVTVQNASIATIQAETKIVADTPLLQCTGDIQDNCETNSRTMKEMRDVYNGHDHAVRGVQPGSSTVTTDHPNQTE